MKEDESMPFELLRKSFYMFIRDRQAIIMFFLLPIIMMIILGFVIAGMSGSTTGVNVKIVTYSDSPEFASLISKEASNIGLNFIFVKTPDDVEELLKAGKAQMGLLINKGVFTFVYDQSYGQYNNYLKDLQDIIANNVNEYLSNVKSFIKIEPIPAKKGNLTVIGFVVPGVIAIAIMIAGIFGMAIVSGNYRQNGVLKRMNVTPVNGGYFFLSLSLIRFFSSLLSAILTVLISEIIFSTGYSINWFYFIIFTSSGILLSLGFGTIFSIFSRDLWTILNLSTIFSIVMMLFSNVFFPYSIMPAYMRIISSMLPISYFAQGLRYVLGIEMMHTENFLIISTIFAFGGITMIILGGHLIFKLEKN